MYQFRFRELASYLFEATAQVKDPVNDPTFDPTKGSYIYDTRVCDSYGGQHNWDSKIYYERIPEGERSINPLLEQNARY